MACGPLRGDKHINVFAHNVMHPQIVYFDGQFNDARMAVALACTAALGGATVANHTEVTGLIKVHPQPITTGFTIVHHICLFGTHIHIHLLACDTGLAVTRIIGAQDADGKVAGAKVKDNESGKQFDVYAKVPECGYFMKWEYGK
jgi:glycerol-3-phosphate dehydrogenase